MSSNEFHADGTIHQDSTYLIQFDESDNQGLFCTCFKSLLKMWGILNKPDCIFEIFYFND